MGTVNTKKKPKVGALAAASKDKPDDDKDPDDDSEDDEAAKLAADHEPNRAAAEAACMKAAASWKAAAGSDSIGLLNRAERDSASCRDACSAAEGSSSAMRGVALDPEAAPPSDRTGTATPPAPPAPSARAIAAAGGGIASQAIAATGLVELGRFALSALGTSDPIAARGILQARLETAARAELAMKSERAALVESATVKRAAMWEAAIGSKFTTGQVFTRAEGSDGKPVRTYAEHATKINAAHPDLASLASYLDSMPSLVGVQGDRSEAALAEVAAAGGPVVTAEIQRASSMVDGGVSPGLLAAALRLQQGGGASSSPDRA